MSLHTPRSVFGYSMFTQLLAGFQCLWRSTTSGLYRSILLRYQWHDSHSCHKYDSLGLDHNLIKENMFARNLEFLNDLMNDFDYNHGL